MPLLCLTCGMPIAHKQFTYDSYLEDGLTPAEAFEKLDVKNVCCRIAIRSAPLEPRFRRLLPAKKLSVQVQYASRLDADTAYFHADGRTNPVKGVQDVLPSLCGGRPADVKS